MKKLLSFALLIALLASFPACKDDREQTPAGSDTVAIGTEEAASATVAFWLR